MKTSVIEVHDMLSVWSVDEVEKRIGQMPGVESVTVNYAAKSATVRYDETRLEIADIKSSVRQSGFESAGESPPTPKPESASASTPAPTASAGAAPQDKATPDASPSTPGAAAPKPPTDKPVAAPAAGGHKDHHAHMAADSRKRFWISLVLTLPILVLSPMLQKLMGLREAIRFTGDIYVLFGFSSAVFWYGGWPFLKGFFGEIETRRPGMMTLISVAIAIAYLYSGAVVFGLTGKMFFWELATLVDIMLLGHWIKMKSVMGASKALEELAKLMPSDAHKLMPDGSVKDVPLGELAVNDKVLIKPGEKIPADGVIVAGESSVNEAMLTGESTPAAKKTGGKVIGGAINGDTLSAFWDYWRAELKIMFWSRAMTSLNKSASESHAHH